jgi:hypothetical protein
MLSPKPRYLTSPSSFLSDRRRELLNFDSALIFVAVKKIKAEKTNFVVVKKNNGMVFPKYKKLITSGSW